MEYSYWSSLYFNWSWFLWFGIFFLLVSSMGSWRNSYRANLKFVRQPHRNAIDLLNERYARGEMLREEYMSVTAKLIK